MLHSNFLEHIRFLNFTWSPYDISSQIKTDLFPPINIILKKSKENKLIYSTSVQTNISKSRTSFLLLLLYLEGANPGQ